MSSVDDALKQGAAVMLVCMILSLMLFVASFCMMAIGRLSSANLATVFEHTNSYSTFENKLVSGDKVQYFIKNYNDRLFLRVSTDKNPAGVCNEDLKHYKDVGHAGYVNPACQYFCTLLHDRNGDVIGANFEQDGVTLTDAELNTAIQECDRRLEE